MEPKTVYACTGECGGVSPVMKNCGDEYCSRHNKPLEARVMCESCAEISGREGKLRVCPACRRA